jgi:hypothetical protein
VIAALFVETNGVYSEVEGVDPWDITRDARLYAGPHPVVAHPPCQRWGRYWSGGPSAKVRRELGDDEGCFASALASVRKWGGVIEHPEASHAWRAHGLFTPPRGGGWIVADDVGGWTCCVEQGHYGHPARKATWLYAVGVVLPSLKWGRSATGGRKLDLGFHSAEERRLFYNPKGLTPEQRTRRVSLMRRKEELTGKASCSPERLTSQERLGTPIAFRDLLLSMAREVSI